MIQQSAIGLNSREEANPFLENGMLPLITAPMNTVIDEWNYQTFIDNKINVCLPRKIDFKDLQNIINLVHGSEFTFMSVSLDEFIEMWCNKDDPKVKFIKATNNDPEPSIYKICIDTANGNMPKLHQSIRTAKELYGENLIIMAGNVGSVRAFEELAKTGVDYIRVGIGGSSVCTTTVHTGVGESDYLSLISLCSINRKVQKEELGHVKIVADSTSRFIKDNKFHPNGYAAINQLLYAGADMIMLGGIFNKAYESAGEKYIQYSDKYYDKIKDAQVYLLGATEEEIKSKYYQYKKLYSLYRGMSTQEEQETYKNGDLRHSEGKTIYNKVEYKLSEWVNGSDSQADEYPGFINALKSAMSYTGSKTLQDFRKIK